VVLADHISQCDVVRLGQWLVVPLSLDLRRGLRGSTVAAGRDDRDEENQQYDAADAPKLAGRRSRNGKRPEGFLPTGRQVEASG
jgi:hypothetical protein